MNSHAGKVLAVVVGVLVLLAVVAGVVSAARDRTELPAGSPEAVVQEYVGRVLDGDLDRAVELLAEDSTCTVEDLTAAYVDRPNRVVLGSTRTDEDQAVVRLDLVRGGDGPFDTEWTQEETFRLVRADDGADWAITGVPWPMPGCGEGWRKP